MIAHAAGHEAVDALMHLVLDRPSLSWHPRTSSRGLEVWDAFGEADSMPIKREPSQAVVIAHAKTPIRTVSRQPEPTINSSFDCGRTGHAIGPANSSR